MKFLVLTLFPEMFESPFAESIIKRAQDQKLINIETKNIRDFASGKRKNVDDVPFGGGAGMLMKPEPLFEAIKWAKKKSGKKAKVIFLTPQGKNLTQQKSEKLAQEKNNLILLCGHFEGIDQRVRDELVDEEISIGDFVLTGGELPAMCLIDSVARLIPGVVGGEESLDKESFSEELFYQKEFPQYTRPADFKGMKVPKVLRSGNHAKIEKWQFKNLKGVPDDEKNFLQLRKNAFPLKTKRLILRLSEKNDLNAWVKWFNDKKVVKYLKSIVPPVNYEMEEEFYISSKKDLRNFQLSIIDKKTKKPIGNTSLRVHPCNSFSLEFGIVIGEKKYWGQGIATEVLQGLLRFAFEIADFERVSLYVYKANKPACRVYEKCGFRYVGELKKFYYKENKFHDTFLMEILKKDYLKSKK